MRIMLGEKLLEKMGFVRAERLREMKKTNLKLNHKIGDQRHEIDRLRAEVMELEGELEEKEERVEELGGQAVGDRDRRGE